MKRYAVSKYFRITIIITICSIYLILSAAIDKYRYNHPIELKGDKLAHIRGNQYVWMEIEHYVVSDGKWHVIMTDLYMSKEYDTYTVEIGDGAFVQLSVGDKNTIETLESFSEGFGETLIIRGKVVNRAAGNLEWYDKVEGFNCDNLHKDQQIIQVTDEEINSRDKSLLIYGGVGFLIAVLLFFSIAGIQVVYVEPFEKTKRFKELAFGKNYTLESDLQKKRNRLTELKLQQIKYKKKIFVGSLVTLAGLTLGIHIIWFSDGSYLVYEILGAGALFIWGLDLLLKALLNSDMKFALEISQLFLLNTIPVQIEETSKIIGVLNKRINDDKKEKV